MFRTAIIAFISVAVMLLISLYLVLSADRILDRTLVGVMENDGITSTATGKPSNQSNPTEISFLRK